MILIFVQSLRIMSLLQCSINRIKPLSSDPISRFDYYTDHSRIPNLPVNPPYDHDEVNHSVEFVNARGATTNHAEVRELIVTNEQCGDMCYAKIPKIVYVPFSNINIRPS